MDKGDVFKMVEHVLHRNKMTQAEFARTLGIHSTTVNSMFMRQTISIDKLVLASERMRYNFFREIGEALDIEEPRAEVLATGEMEQHRLQIAAQQETIRKLEAKVEVLEDLYERTLTTLTGKNLSS